MAALVAVAGVGSVAGFLGGLLGVGGENFILTCPMRGMADGVEIVVKTPTDKVAIHPRPGLVRREPGPPDREG